MLTIAEPFVAQLEQLCRAHPSRAKWIFVPSHAIGRTIGDRLALAGTHWANLRFVTAFDVALRMGAPFLVERGIDPSEEQLGPALIMRLLFALHNTPAYFKPLAHEPKLAAALWASIRELRLANIPSSALTTRAFASKDKAAELTALLKAYEDHLAAHNLGDQATVYLEALTHKDWCPIQPADCWATLPGTIWTPLETQLLATLPGERVRLPDTRPFNIARPRRLTTFASSPTPPPTVAATVEFFQAGGPDAEIDEVLRRIAASGKSLDEIEIACAAEGYATLIWEKALRFNWNVSLSSGLPATLTRPGRALIGYIEWIEDDFAAGKLRRLLQSGDVRLPESLNLRASRAANVLVKAEAAWGRETFRLSLSKLARSERDRAAELATPEEREPCEQRATEADALRTWITAVVNDVPTVDANGEIDLQSLVEAAATFIDEAAATPSALDRAAAARLVASIRELKALGPFRCKLSQALRFVRERVDGLRVGADRPRPGYLYVSTLRDLGLAGRPRIFVVGLEESRVFPTAYEDPILLDDERAAIDESLSRSIDRVDEAVWTALGRLQTVMETAGATMSLSYSCRDLRQFRNTYASWVMLHVFRLATKNETAGYKELRDHVGEPVSPVPADGQETLGVGQWWLRASVAAGEEAAAEAVPRAFAPLGQGIAAADARESERFTEYDGYVPEAGTVLDPALPNRVVSPTQLEEIGACAFRFFVKRGLGVYGIDSGERDRDAWLNPMIRGSLLHAMYESLLRRCRDEGRTVTAKTDRQWLREQGEAQLAELAVEMPPPSAEVKDREWRDYLADLDLFIDGEEEQATARTPVGLEVGFGSRHQENGEPLGQKEPVEIIVGGVTIRMSGRIDRIDQLTDGTFEIVDYKTGSFYEPSWMGTFAGGRRLQHALYGLVALELLKRKFTKPIVSQAQYYFSSTKGQQHRKVIPMVPTAEISTVLNDIRGVVATGAFITTADKDDCKFCDYQPACFGEAANRQAEAKHTAAALAENRRLADRG